MYNMMNNTGWGSGLLLFWGLHVVSVFVFGIGVALLLCWAFKHLSANALWKWGWIFVVIGTVLCLFTIPAWPAFGMMGSSGYGFGATGYGMMGAWQNAPQGGESSSQQQEEANGKALYDKLQAKQATCTDLSDNDFELIGEYLMGLRAGANHEQMNNMMKQMMGDDAPMHIFLGRNATGCTTGTQSSQPYGGMMNGGGMMRGFNASSSAQ